MIVKVCGLREADNIRAVEAAGANWTGFIFYPPSPRACTVLPAYLPQQARRVGVFVAPTEEQVLARTAEFGLSIVQLHGAATPQLCRRLRAAGLTVVRALPADASLPATTAQYADSVDYFLFDTPTAAHGGAGVTFDWQLLRDYRGAVPFLLAGGLGPESLPALAAFSHPRWCGVDLNSRFEVRPGVKDADRIRQFITAFRRQTGA